MWILTFIIVYVVTYIFGAFVFPQIIGSIRMIANGITSPFVFTLILWTLILAGVSIAVYFFLNAYFYSYLLALVIPFFLTLKTKNIE